MKPEKPSEQFATVGERNTVDRRIRMFCAVWARPSGHICIGAPNLDALATAWRKLTSTELKRESAQDVSVMDSKWFEWPEAAPEATEQADVL